MKQNSGKTYSSENISNLDLDPKGQGHSKKANKLGNKNMPPLKTEQAFPC